MGHSDRQHPGVQEQRFAAQLLTGPPSRSAVEVAGRLLAIQAQDPRGARLAIRARSAGLTAADIDRALTDDRSLVVTWLNRGTLHLVRSQDYWWLHALTTTRSQHRGNTLLWLARQGVSADEADKSVAVVEQALAADGPLTGAQLADRLVSSGLPPAGGVPLRLLVLASLRGIAVRGPLVGRQQCYVHVRDWLGTPPEPVPDLDTALGWLARRYLAGHGPADVRDLARWAGLLVSHARRGLTAIAGELADRPDGLAELAGGPAAEEWAGGMPAPRLLGPFDPILHGWVSRAEILDGHAEIVTFNGLFRAFALVAGKAAGTWTYSGGQVALHRFGVLPPDAEAALAAEAADVRRFLVAGSQPSSWPAGQDLALEGDG